MKGMTMNNRTLLKAAGTVLLLPLVSVGIAHAVAGSPKHRVLVAAPDTVAVTETTATTASPTTIAPTTVATATPTTTVTTTQPAPPPTAPPCLNSSDPSCGPRSWVTPPAAKTPMVIVVTASASGLDATFVANVHDDQKAIDHGCVTVDFGDGVGQPAHCDILDCAGSYGPWVPPVLTPDDFTATYRHTYAAPGTYRVGFWFQTVPACADDPYTNVGSQTVTVEVTGE